MIAISESEIDVFPLVQKLGSVDPIECLESRESLVAIGHRALIPLLHALRHLSPPACWEATKVLATLKDPAAANALADALDHDHQGVRWLAAEGLIALGKEGLKQTLVTLLTKAHSNWVREGAHHVIRHFAHRISGRFLLPLLDLFDGFEPAVTLPLAALEALHELRDREVKAIVEASQIRKERLL